MTLLIVHMYMYSKSVIIRWLIGHSAWVATIIWFGLCIVFMYWEHFIKILHSERMRTLKTKKCKFFLKVKKCLECSETKEIFEMVSVNDYFLKILTLFKYFLVFFSSKSSITDFFCSKTCKLIHVKKQVRLKLNFRVRLKLNVSTSVIETIAICNYINM